MAGEGMSDLGDHGMAGAVGAAIVGAFAAMKRALSNKSELPQPDTRVDALVSQVAALAAAVEQQSETSERQWQAVEALAESVRSLRDVVIRLDTLNVEREARRKKDE